jgi:hypothetical protein
MASNKTIPWTPAQNYYSRRVEIAQTFFEARKKILKQCESAARDSKISPQEREKMASVAFMNYRSPSTEQHDNLIYALSAFASQGLKSNEKAFHLLTIDQEYGYEMICAGLKNLDKKMFSALQENPLSPQRQKGNAFRKATDYVRSKIGGRGGK